VADQSDGQLMQRLQQGDRHAIEYLIERYQRPLFNFALRFLGDDDAAADICQFTFIQLYTHIAELETEESVRPWLFRVARHRCLDELRRQRTTPFSRLSAEAANSDDAPSPLEQLADTTPLPEDIAERADLQQILAGAIAALPPKYREVVTLRYAADLSFAEIGEVLGIPEATAKTHFHRAKPLLRAALRARGITNTV
jgi:RNA polymerase sigma factor (sigma-70 family)